MAVIVDIHYSDLDQTFPALLIVMLLPAVVCQCLGYIYAIMFGERGLVACTLTISWMALLSSFLITSRDVSSFVEHAFMNLNPLYLGISHILIIIYGFDRCPDGFISAPMFIYKYDNDMFDKSTLVLTLEATGLTVLTYVCLKIRVNWHLFETVIIYMKNKIHL